MPFKGILKGIVDRVKGAQGAILLDWEGEAVDQYAVISEYDIKFIGAHMGILLYNLNKRLSEELGDDDIKGVTIDLGKKRFAIYPVDKDYFAVLVLSPEAVSGLVRHEIEATVKAIREQF
jgi:predicted regulator of Ras-like GTPase activity (Roadblock/LC7/MglB family)